jgi:aryl-alcohol dehydrogenase-like predicted oxidoreductase
MAQTYGVGITVWSPLAGGVLTGKYRQPSAQRTRFSDDKESDWASKHFTAEADVVVDAVVRLAKDKGCTPAQLCLAWLLAQPAVSSVVIGARDAVQFTDQLGAVTVVLSDDELAELDRISPPGRAVVPYFLDDSFADLRPHLHRW